MVWMKSPNRTNSRSPSLVRLDPCDGEAVFVCHTFLGTNTDQSTLLPVSLSLPLPPPPSSSSPSPLTVMVMVEYNSLQSPATSCRLSVGAVTGLTDSSSVTRAWMAAFLAACGEGGGQGGEEAGGQSDKGSSHRIVELRSQAPTVSY